MNWEIIQKKCNVLKILILICVLVSYGFINHPVKWKKSRLFMREGQVKRLIPIAQNTSDFWIITPGSLYRSHQLKDTSLILHKQVNYVYQNTDQPADVYAATTDGLFLSRDQKEFQRVYYSSETLRRDCQAVITHANVVYLGTRKGLLKMDSKTQSWDPIDGDFSNDPIYQLSSYGDVIYVTTDHALYRYDPRDNSYKKIFSAGSIQEEQETIEESIEDSDIEEGPSAFREIVDVEVIDDHKVYVLTRKGVFYSSHDFDKWNELPGRGLPEHGLTALLVSEDSEVQQPSLWVSSDSGVYQWRATRWEQAYQGLETNRIYDLARDQEGGIYAASDRGIFFWTSEKAILLDDGILTDNASGTIAFKTYKDIEEYFDFEPNILEVQSKAIDYAEVHPDKIKRWRKQARMRAFVPSVSAGIDRNATELLHWDTGSSPDALTKGKEYLDWDAGFSWDFADLVWSSDQTSIDSRSKLMVELREDVLDQVTRLYFERRRQQLELLNQKDLSSESSIDRHMRLAELTAMIDGYTGGWFSGEMRRREIARLRVED